MSIFYDRFCSMCEEINTSPNAVAKKLDIPSGSITAWKNDSEPRAKTVLKLADFFHVTVDYLIGNVNDPFFVMDNERTLRDINSYGDEPFVRKATDDSIKAAFWGGDKNLSEADLDELWQDVQEYARFKAEQKKKKDR